jgi:glycosyltransferase involved in cell wall biosynthesis
MERISLYIPCYNAEKSINDCLQSVFNQSYKIDEILIIDDGSQDRTVEIAERYPVRIIRHKQNKGLAACRNTAFRKANNEFIASLDSDCIADPKWLTQLVNCFSDDDIAGAGGILIDRYTLSTADTWRSVHMAQHWGAELIEYPPFLYGNNTLFRKKSIEKAGFYNEKYRTNYEDLDICMRIYNCGFKLIYNPKAHVEHLRKDTIKSVLFSYWSWFYYKYMMSNQINRLSLRIAVMLGRMVEYTEISEVFFREDFREGEYKLLPIDVLFILYCWWFELRHCIKSINFIGK